MNDILPNRLLFGGIHYYTLLYIIGNFQPYCELMPVRSLADLTIRALTPEQRESIRPNVIYSPRAEKAPRLSWKGRPWCRDKNGTHTFV